MYTVNDLTNSMKKKFSGKYGGVPHGVWSTHEKGTLKIQDMIPNHLANAIQMILRNIDKVLDETCQYYWKNKISKDSNEQMNHFLDEMERFSSHEFALSNIPKYRELVEEADRRKIKYSTSPAVYGKEPRYAKSN